MICLVLAAGYATRLYPLTENFPKPLLPVGDKTILDWLLDDIDASADVAQYVILSNHKFAHHFEAWASAKRLSAPITVLDDGSESNETRLGAVKDIQFAIDTLNLQDDLLVIAGDNVLDFSLGAFVVYADEKRTACILRYFEPDENRLKKCGVALVDDTDRVTRMEEKPREPFANWCTPPFYYYPKNDLPLIRKAIAAGCNTDAPGSLVAWIASQVPVHAMEMPGKRYDVGNLENYEKIQATYRGIVEGQ